MGDVRRDWRDHAAHAEQAAAMSSSPDDLAAFESCRLDLVLLAYRMLGDMGRAEGAVQENRAEGKAESPRAYLISIVTRLCLNELESARARREETRGDRLADPTRLDHLTAS
ncbi:MAG: hypothetical protein ACRELB_27770 [Polyangiaceae bacterium]